MAFRVLETSGLERATRRALGAEPTPGFPGVLLEVAAAAGLVVPTQEDFHVSPAGDDRPRLRLEHPEDEPPVVFSHRRGAWRLEEGAVVGSGPSTQTVFDLSDAQRPERLVAFQRGVGTDRTATPGLVALDVGSWRWSDLRPGTTLKKRVVVFIHGFGSSVEAGFNPPTPPLPPLKDGTTNLGFNHETWFTAPDENAHQLVALLEPFGETLGQSTVVLIAHSRGGLVARSFFEVARGRGWDVSQITTFGTPHQGTTLAKSAFSLFNVLLNQIIQAVGVPSVLARDLGRVLTAVIEHQVFPGVDAMVPGSPFLKTLPAAPRLPLDQRPCHGAVFVPDGFWKGAADFLYTVVAFHGERNDLVVDTDHMVYRGDTLVPFVLMKTHFEYFCEAPDLLTAAM